MNGQLNECVNEGMDEEMNKRWNEWISEIKDLRMDECMNEGGKLIVVYRMSL